MCGIFGFNWDDKKLLKTMSTVLRHRGPDDTAFYTDKNISLGMRRLSIIDLKKGIYPVKNEDESIIAIFNGELFNYNEIKEKLASKGHKFITSCDAEIIPHAYEEYGLDFIKSVNGQFAIAMFDKRNNKLILIRDRLGILPLYYYYDPKSNMFAFASEIKVLLQIPEYKKAINLEALNEYFTYRFIPGKDTIFMGIKRLETGHILVFEKDIKISSYWEFAFHESNNTFAENAEKIRELLEDSVKIRLMSDVPLGAYLSGGLDSSAIVAFMAKHSDNVNTFNVSFPGTLQDESKYAQLVAETFSTNHKQIEVDVDAVKILPQVAWHLDEPIADGATIPTFLMSRETKKVATVVLSGEGSDEIFGGYERFRHLNIAYKFRKISSTFGKFKPRTKNIYAARLINLVSNLENKSKAYLAYYSVFDETDKKDLYSKNFSVKKEPNLDEFFKGSFYDGILSFDTKERLPNNMLLKNDKMSMANSIEGRVPFLDHRLVELSATIPFSQKISVFNDKIVYRYAMKGILPKEILKRKKQGFTIPTEEWAKHGLKDYLSDLVKDNKEPYLNQETIEKISSNIGKSFYYKRQFWAVLMYEQWYNKFML